MAPYLGIGQLLTVAYFIILLFIFPLNNFFERLLYDVYIWRNGIAFSVNDGGRLHIIKKSFLIFIKN
jgi:hypothetical protein